MGQLTDRITALQAEIAAISARLSAAASGVKRFRAGDGVMEVEYSDQLRRQDESRLDMLRGELSLLQHASGGQTLARRGIEG